MYINVYDKYKFSNFYARDYNYKEEIMYHEFLKDIDADETALTDMIQDYVDALLTEPHFYQQDKKVKQYFELGDIEFKPSEQTYKSFEINFINEDYDTYVRDDITDIINKHIKKALDDDESIIVMQFGEIYDALQSIVNKFVAEDIVRQLVECIQYTDDKIYDDTKYYASSILDHIELDYMNNVANLDELLATHITIITKIGKGIIGYFNGIVI